MSAPVYLVGAGPGDSELITLKGARLLSECGAVVYDNLVSEELLELAPPEAELIFAGKTGGGSSTPQEEINKKLIELSRAGKTTVRLKGGDTAIFSRVCEEAAALREAGIEYEIIPGVSSASAAPLAAGIPLTDRESSSAVHIVTGHTKDGGFGEELPLLAKLSGTLVFLMGLSSAEDIARGLMEGGMSPDTPAAVISNGSLPSQSEVRTNLAALGREAQKMSAPAVIVVGKTTAEDIRSRSGRPLEGVKISVVSSSSFMERFRALAEERGAQVGAGCILWTRRLDPRVDIGPFSWIAFTSPNGADSFFAHFKKTGGDWRDLAGKRFAAVGSATAQMVRRYFIEPDLVPEKASGAGLAAELVKRVKKGERVLLPRAKHPSPEICRILEEGGVDFEEVKFYDVTPSNPVTLEAEFTVFASAAGVRSYFEGGGRIHDKAAAMGESAIRALEARGIEAAVKCPQPGAERLLAAIEEAVRAE